MLRIFLGNRSRIAAALLILSVPSGQSAAMTSRYNEAYPGAPSKKGLQVEMVDDALTLGVKHAALNFNVTTLIDLGGDSNNPSWESAGRKFHFHRADLEQMDRRIKTLSDRGVLVNLIVLAYASGQPELDKISLHPNYDPTAPNRLGAFNTVTEEGRRWFIALMEFIAERWSHPERRHGRVVGYIMGNEVNSHWWWANRGRVTMTEFADDYLRTVRLAQQAVRAQASWPRVYLSLEHHWSMRYGAGDELQAFAGRAFLDYFAQRARETGDFDWHLAFHPYPENLFEPRFWNDRSATTNADTKRITFKNIEVLTDYLRRPELLYEGKPRRIIFSEQGFHTPDGPDGEAIQAAAYCYAYKKIEVLEGIDAFILHRHVDHPHEGGLLLGLRRMHPNTEEARPRKRIYECFRVADTPDWKKTFEFALPLVGLEHWPVVGSR